MEGQNKGTRLIRFAFTNDLILNSKPTVNSSRYTVVLIRTKTKSGLRESPVIKYGNENEGRSEYNELSFNKDRVLEIHKRTEI